jgi:hypothetical protein
MYRIDLKQYDWPIEHAYVETIQDLIVWLDNHQSLESIQVLAITNEERQTTKVHQAHHHKRRRH